MDLEIFMVYKTVQMGCFVFGNPTIPYLGLDFKTPKDKAYFLVAMLLVGSIFPLKTRFQTCGCISLKMGKNVVQR